jgi:isovaleryl-CoA dehydrogenase
MGLDDMLSLKPEHVTLRTLVSEFARDNLVQLYDTQDKTALFNAAFLAAAQRDLLGATVPQSLGGAGFDSVASVVINEKLAEFDPGFALSYLAHSLLFVHKLAVHGSDEQKANYLEKVISGQWRAGMAMTEPHGGSNLFDMKTTARLQGDNWVINGQKSFITNPDGKVFFVYASADGLPSVFLVESGYEGFSQGTMWPHKIGLKSSPWGDLHFDDCKVPKENLVGKVGDGKHLAFNILEIERLGLAAISYGIAQRCYEEMLKHSTIERKPDNTLMDFGAIQMYVAGALGDLENGRPALYQAARHFDEQCSSGQVPEDNISRIMRANLLKAHATQVSERIARNALQVQGAHGFASEDYVSGRFLTDQIGISIGGGPLEVLYSYVARKLAKGYRT